MEKKQSRENFLCIWGALGILILSAFFFSLTVVSATPDFSVNSVLLKVSLRGEDLVTKSITLSSSGPGDFSVTPISLQGVSISEQNFFVSETTSRNVDILFNSSGISPGVYVGHIEIKSGKDVTSIPVIFEVESSDLFFDANLDIPPAYKEVEQGSKIIVQVKIFDLTAGGGIQQGLGPTSVSIDYHVVDLNGKVISSESEDMVVNNQAQVTKTIAFPKQVAEGDYVLTAVVRYKSSIGVSSQKFFIIAGKRDSLFPFSYNDYGLLFVLGVLTFFFIGIVILFVYLIHDRDRLLLELRKYLEEMGCEYTAIFDPNFGCTFITTTGPCEYDNFSAGERRRIDIATTFAFRDLLFGQGTLQSNVLICDEIFDVSIDEFCVNSIIKLLKDEAETQTIYIISHRECIDSEGDFDNVIELKKEGGFTSIVSDVQGGVE